MEKTKTSLVADYKRIITLLLIIVQSCGIRFFSGQGTIIMCVVLCLTINNLRLLRKNDANLLIGCLFFLICSCLINQSFLFSSAIFQFGLIVQTYLFLLGYKNSGFNILINDFISCLNLILLHALLSYFIYYIFRSYAEEVDYSAMTYLSVFKIFFVSRVDSTIRNTGICWEPGILQLMMHLLLFYSIRTNRSLYFLVLIVLVIITTFSTTGYILFAINYVYYLILNYKKRSHRTIILIALTVIFSSSLYFLTNNITDKVGGENTSGLVRYRDFNLGIELIKEKPLLGHGKFETSYLLSKTYVAALENELFSDQFLNSAGEMSGGFTNGLFDIFIWFGLPLGFIIYYYFYFNVFAGDKRYEKVIFILILILTFLAEPITDTSFFLLFPLSKLILANQRIIVKSFSYAA